MKYGFTCGRCHATEKSTDWCIIRDKATEHLARCATTELKICTDLTIPNGGIIAFRKKTLEK